MPSSDKNQQRCSSAIETMVNYLEYGGFPQPILFPGRYCEGLTTYPPNLNTLTQSDINNALDVDKYICTDNTIEGCPVPLVRSMIVPDNVKIQFRANQTDTKGKNLSNIINELGMLNIYSTSNNVSNNLVRDMGGEYNDSSSKFAFTWNSASCPHAPGEPTGCRNADDANNCMLKVPDMRRYTYNDNNEQDIDSKLLQSMVSCNSSVSIAFKGINVAAYDPTKMPAGHRWPLTWYANDSYYGSKKSANPTSSYTTNSCSPGGGNSLEGEVYNMIWKDNPPDNEELYLGCSEKILEDMRVPAIQTCSCIGDYELAKANATASVYDTNKRKHHRGGIFNRLCGVGEVDWSVIINPSSGERKFYYDRYFCLCSDSDNIRKIEGSVDQMTISFVDDDKNTISWEQLQVLSCTKGMILGGIPIQRYKHGTKACDSIMKKACINTASTTLSDSLLVSCKCVDEQRRLEAQFSGIDLPIQCFTTVCDQSAKDVYRTQEQVAGCSARLCSQTLSVHGSNIMVQGFQEIVCNGTVYDLSELPKPYTPEKVTGAEPSSDDIVLGPLFYIAIGLLGMLLILVTVWVVRRSRLNSKRKLRKKKKLENAILKRI